MLVLPPVQSAAMRKEVSRCLEAIIQTDYMAIQTKYLPAARHFKMVTETKMLTDGLKTLDKAHANVGKVCFLRVCVKQHSQ